MSTTNEKNKEVVNVDEDDDNDDEEEEEDIIEEEQLEEYREMVQNLGTFPDKVKINSLSMVADDHSESKHNAGEIYKVIRAQLLSKKISSDHLLPLVYLIDSILKNVKGVYIPIIEQDASTWLSVVYEALSEDKRVKLKKVYNLWKDMGIFSEASWKRMGESFSGGAGVGGGDSSSPDSNPKLEAAGIVMGKDGGLLLMPNVRAAMQTILDELQSDVQNELEKVSLERLAVIDADLLVKIKLTAEDSIRSGSGSTNSTGRSAPQNETDVLSFITDTRTPESLERSKAWSKVKIDPIKDTNDMIAALRQVVIDISTSDATYTQKEAIHMTSSLGAAGAMANMLTTVLEQMRDADKKAKASVVPSLSGSGKASGSHARGFFAVDKSQFTNEGIKKKNLAVVGLLYEVGLPFVSSADGRRFATEFELSSHLDTLFKRRQLEKTIARTEERGWYVSDAVWCGEARDDEEDTNIAEDRPEGAAGGTEDVLDPSTFTFPADESRDRCVICGINFKMFFDNDDGIYKYSNCREIDVLLEEMAAKEKEPVLVHVTCWRALGSPATLEVDQTLEEAMPS